MQDVADEVWGNWLAKVDHRAAVIDWAVAILVAGGEGQATTLLAGADEEFEKLFRRAVLEQGLALPHGEEWEILERHWCRQIVEGKLEPLPGLAQLCEVWREYLDLPWKPLMDPARERLGRWGMLSESVVLMDDGYGGLEPFEELTLETVGETILDEARRVLSL